MLIEYLNRRRGERTKSVNGNDYAFTFVDDRLVCDVAEPDCQVFLSYPELYTELESSEVPMDYKLSDIDTDDIDAVIEFANSVQDEVVYSRRNKREKILADLVENGF